MRIERNGPVKRRLIRCRATNNFDKGQQIGRVEGMADNGALRCWAIGLNVGHRQAGGAGGDHHISRDERTEAGIKRLLDRQTFRRGFLDKLGAGNSLFQIICDQEVVTAGPDGKANLCKALPGGVDNRTKNGFFIHAVKIGADLIATGEEKGGPATTDWPGTNAGHGMDFAG